MDKLSEVLEVNVDELILGECIKKIASTGSSMFQVKPDFGRFDAESEKDKEQAYRQFLGHQYVKGKVLALRRYLIGITVLMVLAGGYFVGVKKGFISLAVKMHMRNEIHINMDIDDIVISEYMDGFEGYTVWIMDGDETVQTLFVSGAPLPVVGRFLPGNIRCMVCGLPG